MPSLTLNIPAGNGVGTASDADTLATTKTVLVTGPFQGIAVLEAQLGSTGWCQVATFNGPAQKTIKAAATALRVRIQGYISGTPIVTVSAEDAAISGIELDVPTADGVGTASDISKLGDELTAVVIGNFTGALSIEVSNDGTNFRPAFPTFTASGCRTTVAPVSQARVRRTGILPGGATPVVSVGAEVKSGAGAGISTTVQVEGTLNVYVDADAGDDANGGLSPTDALQTMAAVYDKFPTSAIQPGEVVINFAAGAGGTQATYEVYPLFSEGRGVVKALYRYVGPDFIAFSPTTGPSSATLDAGTPATRIDASDAASGSGLRCQLNFTTAAPGWTAEDFAGVAFVRITRGAQRVVAEMPISGNTADTIYVDHEGLVGVVQAGDLVEVVIPGAALTAPAGLFFLSTTGDSALFPTSFISDRQPTFSRLDMSNGGFYRTVCIFDRCNIEGFFEAGLPVFSNCINNIGPRINGCSGSVTETGIFVVADETDPIDDSIWINLTVAGNSAGIQHGFPQLLGDSIGYGTYIWARASVRRLNPANGLTSGWLVTQAGQRIIFGTLILPGVGGGSGALINLSGNGWMKLPVQANGDFHQGGTLQGIRLAAAPLAVDLDAGVGGFYEVAGYNGNFFNPPASPGDQGDFSVARDSFL